MKSKILLIIGTAVLLSPVMVPAIASAQVTNQTIQSNLCAGTNAQAAGSTTGCDSSSASSTFDNIITTIINIFSIVVGGVSVIMIIVGGFRYIISGGNDSSVSGAKNTIIYALIGLVIVALAQLIVHFVLAKAIQAGGS